MQKELFCLEDRLDAVLAKTATKKTTPKSAKKEVPNHHSDPTEFQNVGLRVSSDLNIFEDTKITSINMTENKFEIRGDFSKFLEETKDFLYDAEQYFTNVFTTKSVDAKKIVLVRTQNIMI